MKTINCFKIALILLVFVSFSINATPVTKSINNSNYFLECTQSNAHMECTGTSDGLSVTYTNSDQEDLTFVIRSVSGEVLTTVHKSELTGQLFISNADLIAKGGTGTYYVSMYAGQPSKKVETIVIIIFSE